MKKIILNNEKGFALLAALMACLILIAIGILVINMSTGNLMSSSLTVGNKKAMLAAESGVPKLLNDIQPEHWTTGDPYHYSPATYTDLLGNIKNCGADDYPDSSYDWITINNGIDTHTQFAVCTPTASNEPPIPQYGGELGGGGVSHDNPQAYIYRYDSTVVGKNTSYDSQAKVGIGVGFGPI